MIKWVVDERTYQELLGCLEELELYNESGELMARLTPDPAYRKRTYDRINALFPEERIRAAGNQPRGKGRTLADILKDLEPGNGSLHRQLASPGGAEASRPVAEGGGS
jgi:hypothetical protein